MQSLRLTLFILCVVFSFSCKDNPTKPDNTLPTRALSLSAKITAGTAPCDIILIGTFNAYTDTTKMRYPDMFIIGAAGLTVIPYSLSDTTVSAKRTYIDTLHFPYTGTYSIHMLLQTTTQNISSDTMTITIY